MAAKARGVKLGQTPVKQKRWRPKLEVARRLLFEGKICFFSKALAGS